MGAPPSIDLGASVGQGLGVRTEAQTYRFGYIHSGVVGTPMVRRHIRMVKVGSGPLLKQRSRGDWP